jgi:hypothetical protein
MLAAVAGASRAGNRSHQASYQRRGKNHDRQRHRPRDCPGDKPVCDPRSTQRSHPGGGHGARDTGRYGGLNDAVSKRCASRGDNHIDGRLADLVATPPHIAIRRCGGIQWRFSVLSRWKAAHGVSPRNSATRIGADLRAIRNYSPYSVMNRLNLPGAATPISELPSRYAD